MQIFIYCLFYTIAVICPKRGPRFPYDTVVYFCFVVFALPEGVVSVVSLILDHYCLTFFFIYKIHKF